MKNKSGKILKCGLAFTFAFSLVNVNQLKVLAAPENKVTVDIYPKPQAVSYLSDQGMTLQGDVNVVIHGQQEHATMTKLDEILKSNNISYTISDAKDEQKANIFISSSKDHCDECNDDDIALNEKEGYVLKSSDDDNSKGEISIIGSDEDGAYYGVITLGQILDQKIENKFAEVVISDYPEIEFRGFIEGFYGDPWTHQERMSLMKDTGKYKMNTYIYAPKDDPYHRVQWKALYPTNEAKQIQELAQSGKDNNFNFCWTIHPGATLTFSDSDYDALIAKYEQLYSLGVRQFGVLFDDTDDWYNGQKQAEFINKIDTNFVKAKGDVKPMIVISARYNSAWGPGINNYFKPFMQTLHSDIQVMWTGHATMSNVSRDVFEWPKTQTGVDKDVAVWWNYPVNDYCDSKLVMGAMSNLSPDLDNVSGFFSNPMNQAEASKVALYSIADYTWNTDAYDYLTSWDRSVKELVPEATEEFRRFAQNISYLTDDGGASGPFIFSESDYLEDKVNAFKNAITSNENLTASAQALLEEFQIILNDCDKLEHLNNSGLQEEITPFLNAYKELAKAGVSSLEAINLIQDGNVASAVDKNLLAQQALDKMSTFTVHRMEDSGYKDYVVDVGTKILKPIVKNAIDKNNEMISKNLFPELAPELVSNVDGLTGSVAFEGGSYVVKDIATTLDYGKYITVALPQAKQLSEVIITGSKLENVTVQYSINGIDWIDATVTTSGDTLKLGNFGATYVRLINKTNKSIDINVSNITITPAYKTNPTVTTNLGTYQNYSISKALDGNMDTKFWSDGCPVAGKYVQVDLGNKVPLHDLKIYFDSGDYLPYGQVMVSSDGVSFTKLGDMNYTSLSGKQIATYDGAGQMARYIRIEATGTSTKWLQIYEIEFNKTVSIPSGDEVALVTGNTDGVYANLYDQDLSSAYSPTTINEDSYITYQMTRINNVKDLTFIQDAANICEGKVSIKDTSGVWHEVGNLDKQLTTLNVNKKISEVKITFDSTKPLPKIYEIITSELTESITIDTTKLVEAIERGQDIDRDKYTDLTALDAAIKKGQEIVANPTSEKEVSDAISAIDNAIKNLQLKVEVNKDALAIAVLKANEITDLDNVVPVVVKEFNEALKQATAILNDDKYSQEEVDQAFDRLSSAMQKLSFIKGDKTQLQSMYDKVMALDEQAYIPSTYTTLKAMLPEVKELLKDENALEKEVNEMHDSLTRAFLDLRLKPNKDLLKGLIEKVEGLNEKEYDVTSWKVLKEAVSKANKVYKDNEATSEMVSDAESMLTRAIEGLVKVETEKPNNKPTTNNPTITTPTTNNSITNNSSTSVKTGDEKNIGGLFGLGIIAVITSYLNKRKRFR